jgi:WD40 repeat protein
MRKTFLLILILLPISVPALAADKKTTLCTSAILGVQTQLSGLYDRAHATQSKALYSALQTKLAKTNTAGIDGPDFSRNHENRLDQSGRAERELEDARNSAAEKFHLAQFKEIQKWTNNTSRRLISSSADFSIISTNDPAAMTSRLTEMSTGFNTDLEQAAWLLSPNGSYMLSHLAGKLLVGEANQGGKVELREQLARAPDNQIALHAIDNNGRYVLATRDGDFEFEDFIPTSPSFATTMATLRLSKPSKLQVVVNLKFSDDSRYLFISYNHGRSISVWDTLTGNEVFDFTSGNQVTTFAMSGDGKIFGILRYASRQIFLFDMDTKQVMGKISNASLSRISAFAFSNDSKEIFVAYPDNAHIEVLDTASGLSLESIPTKNNSDSIHFNSENGVLSSLDLTIGNYTVQRWRRP